MTEPRYRVGDNVLVCDSRQHGETVLTEARQVWTAGLRYSLAKVTQVSPAEPGVEGRDYHSYVFTVSTPQGPRARFAPESDLLPGPTDDDVRSYVAWRLKLAVWEPHEVADEEWNRNPMIRAMKANAEEFEKREAETAPPEDRR